MRDIFAVAMRNPLWTGVGYDEFVKFCRCNGAKTKEYDKNDIILLAGDTVDRIGLILSGGVKIVRTDADGRVSILNELGVSELFNEVTISAQLDRSPVTVQTTEKSKVLFINYKKLLDVCTATCPSHLRLIENMLKIVAQRYVRLAQKVEILSKRTIRERLIRYFALHGAVTKKFTIPYNREELANYLGVDRSALSKELGKMRDEGLIRFRKNEFEVL